MSALSPTGISTIVGPAESRVIHAFGAEMTFHLSGDQTEGGFLAATIVAPSGHGPPPHYHLNEDECFFVLEGRVSFLSGSEWHEVAPGAVVFTPKRTVHTYKNVGTTHARMFFTALPSGFDVFFAKCEKEFQKPGGPDKARIVEISAEHGIYYVDP
jgi:mannose-6-phosphate isomerase-like protein (cupin superfamily)